MDQHDFPDNIDDNELEVWLDAALDRISTAADDDIDDQVNREIIRYWNERVGQAVGEDAAVARRIRAAIAARLQDLD